MPLFLTLAIALATRTSPPYDYTSRYLTMRDGVRIAVDLYLPRDRPPGRRVPTILHQTRYFRSHRVMWPAGLFWPGILEPTIARYAAHGYAYVVVDTRGSGASFGTRSQEWSPDEVRDGGEIARWIAAQPWSNGSIGATGVSYDGAASEFLLTNLDPGVKAIAPRSGTYDAYQDTAFPGGVMNAPFIEFWGRMTALQDSNRLSSALSGTARMFYRGVKPVQGDSGEALLAEASREHSTNYNMAAAVGKNEFSDQTDRVRAMSPYAVRERVRQSGAAICSVSGWYDGALVNAAIKRYLSVPTPGSRLILGPWSHQGENLSPFAARLDDFDFTAEVIRFFDRYLKGDTNGIDREVPVRYYTVGEERWKTAPTWPPPGTVSELLYLAEGSALSAATPAAAGSDSYAVDFSTGSGQETRWNNLTGFDIKHSLPRDRRERDRKLRVYTGAPLAADMEVTGHPSVSLFVSSTESDAALFVYLEDVAPNGDVHYVTEGILRLLLRRVSASPPPYEFPTPYRTFAKVDAEPLVPGEIVKADIDLYPISYLFRAGHSVRIAIAGADVDHFAQIPSRAPTLTFYRDIAHPSRVVLPAMTRPNNGRPN